MEHRPMQCQNMALDPWIIGFAVRSGMLINGIGAATRSPPQRESHLPMFPRRQTKVSRATCNSPPIDLLAMHSMMSKRGLQLSLEAGQSLPADVCWRVNAGFLRATGFTNQAEVFTLGIWGPGETVIPQLLTPQPMELRALSAAQVQQWNPDPAEQHGCATTHIQQLGMLLQLTRIRPAEARLFNLLIWLSERFGTSTEHGYSVPLEAINLTHRQLAEMASVSRVTVTKALGHFRQQGWLIRVGELEVLAEPGISSFQSLH